MTVVGNPASDVMSQMEFQPRIAFAVTTAGQLFDSTFELGFAFLMKTKTTLVAFPSVERVPKVFLSDEGADFCLIFVHFQEQFLFYELRDTVTYAFGSTKTFHQYQTVSRAGELPPCALSEPDGNLSAHPAPITQP